MLVVRQVVHLAADEFFTLPAEQRFCRRVHERHLSLRIDRVQSFAHVDRDCPMEFQEFADTGFALFQRNGRMALLLDMGRIWYCRAMRP